MLKSMTGYGVAQVESDVLNITVEVKSLNSKFLDIYCRIPRSFSEREIEIRNVITQTLERGKVELNLTVQQSGDSSGVSVVNRALVKAYFADLSKVASDLGFEPDPTELYRIALQLPNSYNGDVPKEDKREAEWELLQKAVREAIRKCDDFRLQEGEKTAAKLKEYIDRISALLEQVRINDVTRIPAVRERLERNVKELMADESFDKNRFEQELIYYIEKYDISEEKVRLANHLSYFTETLNLPESNGKKLNFIAQEIGREINTIGSKANDAAIQRLVVQMKDELEKIKEQTMNVI